MMWQALPQNWGVEVTCIASSVAITTSPKVSAAPKVATRAAPGVTRPPLSLESQRDSRESGPSSDTALLRPGAVAPEAPQDHDGEEDIEPEEDQHELADSQISKLGVDLVLDLGADRARAGREAGHRLFLQTVR